MMPDNTDSIFSVLKHDSKRRLKEAKRKSFGPTNQNEQDQDELLIAVAAIGGMTGGLVLGKVLRMPLIGAAVGSVAASYTVLTNAKGESGIGDVLRGTGQECIGLYKGVGKLNEANKISQKVKRLVTKCWDRSIYLNEEYGVTKKVGKATNKILKKAKKVNDDEHYTDKFAKFLSKALDSANKALD